MADAPWRCSECGTINEPVANACRTCGRWPSLFDLEESKVDVVDVDDEPGPFLPEAEELEPAEPELEEPEFEEHEEEPEKPRWRRWASVAVPLLIVIYLVISIVAER